MRTLLVSMPFGAIDRPALGISLLKAGLVEHGYHCDIAYLCADFAEMVGLPTYEWLTDGIPYTAFAGDWCFTLALYGRRPELDWAYVTDVLRGTWAMSSRDIDLVVRTRERAPDYIEACLTRCAWQDYDVVGFTSTFTQNLASLALAKRLKETHPHLKIVFGGANWEGEMGEELQDRFGFVDYVCQGESDRTFPALIEALASEQGQPGQIPGVLSRDPNGMRVSGGKAQTVQNLDGLPMPDFSDYFTLLKQRDALAQISPTLLMETSRGCWWGAKHHCTFCGLNGNNMRFRSKSGARALEEFEVLTGRWRAPLVAMVDNILDMDHLRTFLPHLAARSNPTPVFYEVKANLSRKQVRVLADAGVRNIQPGIESLSTGILRLMRKGTTKLRNIQLLKWCREIGISVDWNILYGFPGETDEDYLEMLGDLPALCHLQAPSGCGPVRLDRFSPYFETPEPFGIVNVRPLAVYGYLYPFSDQCLMRVASYFDFDYAEGVGPSIISAEVDRFVADWRRRPNGGELTIRDDGERISILDTRWSYPRAEYHFEGFERQIHLICDAVRSVDNVVQQLEKRNPGVSFDRRHVRDHLDDLAKNGLMVREKDRYLALGIHVRQPTIHAAEVFDSHTPDWPMAEGIRMAAVEQSLVS